MSRTIEQLQSPTEAELWCKAARAAGKSIGFVPTMGALHAGHIGLVRRAREENDLVVVSIFVNPLQFGSQSDLDAYPREFQADSDLLHQAGCDMVFTGTLLGAQGFFPGAEVSADIPGEVPGSNALGLEGEFREGHFEGVATIVRRLFDVAQATRAYFGAKDYQQTLVVSDLARRLGAKAPTVVVCSIARDGSGLARSSRNARLSKDGLRAACSLSRALAAGVKLWREGGERDPQALEAAIAAHLQALEPGAVKLEYAAVRNPDAWTAKRPKALEDVAIALIAAEVEGVRLIDNMRLDVVPAPSPFVLDCGAMESAVVVAEAPAKINPWLEVTGKRPDGFHEVDLTMLCIDLVDHLRVAWIHDSSLQGTPIQLLVSGPAATSDIPLDQSNLVSRAAQLALNAHAGPLPRGHVRIELFKRIPSRAGLGGGSSDASAALAATVRLLELVGSGCGELGSLSAQVKAIAGIGSDCAFFLGASRSGFGRCTGRGERVEELPAGAQNRRSFELVVPGIACGTAAVYGALVLGKKPKDYDSGASFNRLLEPALSAFPALADLRTSLGSDGKGEWQLSGSGSALFRDANAPQWSDLGSTPAPVVAGARYTGMHRPTGFGARILGEVCTGPVFADSKGGQA